MSEICSFFGNIFPFLWSCIVAVYNWMDDEKFIGGALILIAIMQYLFAKRKRYDFLYEHRLKAYLDFVNNIYLFIKSFYKDLSKDLSKDLGEDLSKNLSKDELYDFLTQLDISKYAFPMLFKDDKIMKFADEVVNKARNLCISYNVYMNKKGSWQSEEIERSNCSVEKLYDTFLNELKDFNNYLLDKIIEKHFEEYLKLDKE